jgi:outer membrane protein TolC
VQAETQLLTARANLIDIANTRAQFEHAIAALVGKAPADFSLAERTDVPRCRRPRRRAVRASSAGRTSPPPSGRVAAANAQIGVATAAIYPLAHAVGGWRLHRFERGQLDIAAERFWSLGASLAERCSTAACARQRDEAVAFWDASVAQYRQTARRVPRSRGHTSPRCASRRGGRRAGRRCARRASRSR